jgi:hypothetical protein
VGETGVEADFIHPVKTKLKTKKKNNIILFMLISFAPVGLKNKIFCPLGHIGLAHKHIANRFSFLPTI